MEKQIVATAIVSGMCCVVELRPMTFDPRAFQRKIDAISEKIGSAQIRIKRLRRGVK